MTSNRGSEPITSAELGRAFEVAQNWGGWSFEEAELMARVLLFLRDEAAISARLADETLIVARLRP